VRHPASVVFRAARGARLWDVDGKEYLDTMSGSAGPAMVGYSHPRVVEAVARQMAEVAAVNLMHVTPPVIEFAARLAKLCPPGLEKTFLCPGGGEAVEAAVKLAMRVTGRGEVLSLTGGYHGMSLGLMSLGGIAPLRKWVPGGARWPTFRQVPSADAYRPPLAGGEEGAHGRAWRASVAALESALDWGSSGQVAALVMEVVQGPYGHAVFPPEYYREVQRVCRERQVLLIVDEIQTGVARCGAMWACDLHDLRPDILVFGKCIGGGVPCGGFVARSALVTPELEAEPWHMLTFQNQALQAAAGLAVLDIVEDERLVERARRLGAMATARFRALAERYQVIGDVRGPGLFIGVDYVEDRRSKVPATAACKEAWAWALDRGLITQFGWPGANVLKFKPPLTTPEEDFARMLDLVEEMTAFIQSRVERR
jgi:4-aminobutyrate aminotransferase-like enzyme